jgi:hypothetical protein
MHTTKFDLNLLCYGDYPRLADRLLDSIARSVPWRSVDRIRIGLNCVSDKTKEHAYQFGHFAPVRVSVYRERDNKNVLKYPLMRRMLYDPVRPVAAPHVVWFDDDSFVTGGPRFWDELADLLRGDPGTPPVALAGSKYRPNYFWTPTEVAAIRTQPWYAGASLGDKPEFCTGGFWAAQYAFLKKHGYPFRELKHNGGDVLLGELCEQQRARVAQFRAGVAINADESGRESRAGRRGVTTARPFESWPVADYTHHDFDLVVTDFVPTRVDQGGPPQGPHYP